MDIGVAVAVIVALSLIEPVSAGAVPSFFGRLAFLPLGHFRCGAEQPISRLLASAEPRAEVEPHPMRDAVLYPYARGAAVLRIVRSHWLQPPIGGVVRLSWELEDDELKIRSRYLPMPLSALLGAPIVAALAAPELSLPVAVGEIVLLALAFTRARDLTRRSLRTPPS